MLDKLVGSALGQLALSTEAATESAIIDFIADFLLADFETTRLFSFVLSVIRKKAGVPSKDDSIAKKDMSVVERNIQEIATKKMPRRKNQTLLHEAAGAGNEPLVRLILEVWRLYLERNQPWRLEGSATTSNSVALASFWRARAESSAAESKNGSFPNPAPLPAVFPCSRERPPISRRSQAR